MHLYHRSRICSSLLLHLFCIIIYYWAYYINREILVCAPPILNVVRISVKYGVRVMFRIGIVFRVTVWFYQSVQLRITGSNH